MFRMSLALTMASFLAASAANAQAPSKPADRVTVMLVGLNVADLDRSIPFYSNVLGMKEVRRYTFPQMTEVLMNASGTIDEPFIVLVSRKDAKGPFQPGNAFSRVGLRVTDVRAVVARAKAGGYKVTREPSNRTGEANLAFILDPDGHPFELVEPK